MRAKPSGEEAKPRRTRWIRLLVVVTVAVSLALLALWFVYRPWALNWGASSQEIALAMPGDGILPDPNFNATRAVTVDATPAEIWPWIVQMGYLRAGFYSHDRLDNEGVPSAEHLIPEYQNLHVGDSIPLTARDYVTVTLLDTDSTMLWEYSGDQTTTVFTWAWGLYPISDRQTRLVTRLRYRASSLRSRLMLDFFEIVMMRKCLLGIKRRAESERGRDHSQA